MDATTGQQTCSPRRSTARHASKTARGRCPINIPVRRYRKKANVNNQNDHDAFVNIERTVSLVGILDCGFLNGRPNDCT